MKSPKTLDLRLRPLKSPVREAGDSYSNVSKPLQSPIRQIQDKELKSLKRQTKDKNSVIDCSDLQQSIQKILKSYEQEESLFNEEPSETSKQTKPIQTPTRENQKKKKRKKKPTKLTTLSTK